MILAVVGAKGGVGRSTVALNLGSALDGVVVDADLSMADLPAPHGPDLHDVLADRATPVEAVREDGAFRLLPCGRTLAGARGADHAALPDVLRAVERAYGPVVVDCPAGTGGGVGLVLQAADASVVVTTPDPVATADAARSRAQARAFDAPLAAVAVTRADDAVPTAALEALLGGPVAAVPESPAVATAMRNGQPVAGVAPESDAVRAFERLAALVQRSCRS